MSLERTLNVHNDSDYVDNYDEDLTFAVRDLHDELPYGNFGNVYQAQWKNKEVIVKEINWQEKHWLERCNREKDMMKLCNHPNIVAFFAYHLNMDNHKYSIVMEYIPNGNLH